MSQITDEMVQAAYDISKKAYQDELIQEEGTDILESEYGMDRGSAIDYIHTYLKYSYNHCRYETSGKNDKKQ